MSCLYLHIGTPKTGSTSIQFFCAANRPALQAHGYDYPDLGLGKEHNRNANPLVRFIREEDGNRNFEKENALHTKAIENLLSEFERTENVILSDEGIWTIFHKVECFWENLCSALREHGHTLKVIVYLRRQDASIQSYWMQKVKGIALETDFKEYLQRNPANKIHADYYQTLNEIAETVGKENIIVRPFEPSQFLQIDGKPSLTADFLNCCGLALTDEFQEAQAIHNATIDGDFIEVMRYLNSVPAFQEEKHRKALINLCHRATNKRSEKASYQRAARFPKGKAKAFVKNFAKSNAAVAREYMHRADGVLFQDPVNENYDLMPYSTEELVHACGEMILDLREQIMALRKENNMLKKELEKKN